MEILAIVLLFLLVVTFISIIIKWWFDEYKDDEYISNSDEVFNDFYNLIKEKDDV